MAQSSENEMLRRTRQRNIGPVRSARVLSWFPEGAGVGLICVSDRWNTKAGRGARAMLLNLRSGRIRVHLGLDPGELSENYTAVGVPRDCNNQ
jgi:hypothetical protein